MNGSRLVVLAAAALGVGCHVASTSAEAGASSQSSAVGRAVQGAIDAGRYTTSVVTDDKGGKQTLVRVDALRLSITAGCLGPDKKLSCAAFEGIKAIVDKTVPSGPGSPAAHACKVVGATNATWKDDKGESGMCVFADGSAASDWSFIYTPRLSLGD